MNELVERLTREQPIIASVRPEPTVEGFKAAIDRGYVHLKFTETRGGTELGVRLERDACDFATADFAGKKGAVKLVGGLTLNYNKVRMHATIDLASLRGSGRLEFLGDVKPGESPANEEKSR